MMSGWNWLQLCCLLVLAGAEPDLFGRAAAHGGRKGGKAVLSPGLQTVRQPVGCMHAYSSADSGLLQDRTEQGRMWPS